MGKTGNKHAAAWRNAVLVLAVALCSQGHSSVSLQHSQHVCDLSQSHIPSVEAFSMAGGSVVRAVVASSSSLAPSWFPHRSQS